MNLSSISRFGHTPLEDLIHFRNLVATSLQQRLALAVLDPRIGGETANFDEGGAAEEEARAGVAAHINKSSQRGGERRERKEGRTRESRRRSSESRRLVRGVEAG